MWRNLWRWLVAGNPPRDVPTPAEPVDPAPLVEHDEGSVWCSLCVPPRGKSRHAGIMICAECDLIDFMPGGANELTRLEIDEE